jgi:predicted aspartyl protease
MVDSPQSLSQAVIAWGCTLRPTGSWYGCAVDDIAPSWRTAAPNKASTLPRALLILAGLCARVAAADPTASTLPDPITRAAEGTAETPNIEDSLFASPTTRDHIGRVVVPVKVNGRGPFRFIVDTGANHATISPDLVRVLGLKTNSTSLMTLDGITGAAQVSYVSVDQIQTGDLTIEDTTLPVVWAPVMAGADGILGAAGMSQKSLLIDFKRNQVSIASHVESNARKQAIRVHASRVAHGLLIVEALVGGVRTQAVVDTGAERTLGNIALRDALKQHSRSGRGFVAKLTTVYGATTEVEPGEIQSAPTISLGSLRMTDLAVVYGDFHIFKVWDMQNKPAMILGMDVLGTVASLNIDFKNQDLYVASAITLVQPWRPSTHELNSDQSQKK